MKNIVIFGVILLVILFIMPLFGYGYYFALGIVEWITKYIFPWIVLYWFIRLVKNFEKR